MNVTVILNGYRRPQALKEQYNAIKSQTYPVQHIMFWQNFYTDTVFDSKILENTTSAICNKNLGVWSRFAFALNARTKYVCVIDDDTIPGSQWIENCVRTISMKPGLLGCRGVRMVDDNYRNYPGCNYESICGNENVEEVDIMGHCWFFEKDWLRYYWLDMPKEPLTYGGEDMHFSFSLQRHLDLQTYVPAQPSDNKEMWGSLDPSVYGEDMVATSRTSIGFVEANKHWNFILDNGYKLVKDKK
jgi:hypothetical protein